MVGLRNELFGGQRTCAPPERSEYNDWDVVAGSRGRESSGRRFAAVRLGGFGVDHNQIGPLFRGHLRAAVGPAGLNNLGAASCKERAEQIARFTRSIDNEHARSRGQRRVSKRVGQGGVWRVGIRGGAAENTRGAMISTSAILFSRDAVAERWHHVIRALRYRVAAKRRARGFLYIPGKPRLFAARELLFTPSPLDGTIRPAFDPRRPFRTPSLGAILRPRAGPRTFGQG